MTRPNSEQIAAAANILSSEWDSDGSKAAGERGAYEEWAAGIADMIIHDPPRETLIEYLGVLETQIGVAPSSLADRARWAATLETVVRAQSPTSDHADG